ncbi:hypothetical protein C2G38_2291420 [Gigaspora rosea]|uniref:Protein kinase domain-containing protein n=1 Tax=Gigaspora rosea TaxID=44941 RepID=A0A397VMU3_9GLOM|nr:hypothetical protein C2G38_2291420 [Gigaspora rosea]
MIKWISFDRLVNIKKIGEGGFGSIFSATWVDGIQEIKEIGKTDNDEDDVDNEDIGYNDFNDDNKDDDNYIYMRARKPSALLLSKPHQFVSLTKCGLWGTKLKIYGLTQNTKAS